MTEVGGPLATAEDLGFTQEEPAQNHVCLIFDSDDQRRRVVAEFLAAGLRHGEIVRYFVDASTPALIRSWLDEAGIGVSGEEARGAFAVSSAVNAYCPGGAHDPDTVINGILQGYEDAHQAGYSGSRACGEMSWVTKGVPGSDRFLEYEARLNGIHTPYRHVGMCQYDSRLFDGATLFRLLQVHPLMVAQGQIVRNPYYSWREQVATPVERSRP